MRLSVSVFCAICPGASSSLAGFGSSFGTAEDSRAREPSRLHVHTPAYRRESGTKRLTRLGGRRSALDEIRSGDGNPVLYDGGRRCGPLARTGGASLSPRARMALSAVPQRTFRKDWCDRSTTYPHPERSGATPLVAGAISIARAASPNARLTSSVEHVHTPARHLRHQDLLHPFCGVSAALSAP